TEQPCSCLPPDNGLAVGNGYVVEAVNASEIRISDMSGNALLPEEIKTFFRPCPGAGGGLILALRDPGNRWCVAHVEFSCIGLEFAWSNDANPLDGFNSTFINLGYLLDFPKIGFNADDVVITGDNFGGSNDGQVGILAIDKAALLGGTFTLHTYNFSGY